MSEKLKPCPHCGCGRIVMVTYHEMNMASKKDGERTVIGECIINCVSELTAV